MVVAAVAVVVEVAAVVAVAAVVVVVAVGRALRGRLAGRACARLPRGDVSDSDFLLKSLNIFSSSGG